MMTKRGELRHDVWMSIAYQLARLGTCARRQVGCVMVDADHRLIGHGYNGVARDQTHCTEKLCAGAKSPSGTDLDKCEAIHAEVNAYGNCADILRVSTIYVTASPCVHCVKVLLNTSARLLFFAETYSHGDEALRLWHNAGRTAEQIDWRPTLEERV